MKKPGLSSEICGFFDGNFVPPKSFASFSDDKVKLSQAFGGLSYLIGDFFDEKNISFEFNPNPSVCEVENPFALQVIFAISAIRDHLRRFPGINFVREASMSTSIKGKVNFVKTVTRFYGLMHRTVKEVNSISEKTIERRFLTLALPIIQSKTAAMIGSESNRKLIQMFDECKYHLVSVTAAEDDIFSLSTQIIKKRSGRAGDEQALPYCKILATYLLSEFFLHSGDSDKKNINSFDFLLNLNRPFEAMLRQLIHRKVPPYKELKEGFANLQFLNSKKMALSMRPDIWTIDKDENLIILDAKHKIFDSDFDADEGTGGMKREDLYQLISYIRTNKVNQKEGIFGLVGLTDEMNNSTNEVRPFFESLESLYFELKVENGSSKQVQIQLIKCRFGSILQEFGTRLNDGVSLEGFWANLSDELYSIINSAAEKSKTEAA